MGYVAIHSWKEGWGSGYLALAASIMQGRRRPSGKVSRIHILSLMSCVSFGRSSLLQIGSFLTEHFCLNLKMLLIKVCLNWHLFGDSQGTLAIKISNKFCTKDNSLTVQPSSSKICLTIAPFLINQDSCYYAASIPSGALQETLPC